MSDSNTSLVIRRPISILSTIGGATNMFSTILTTRHLRARKVGPQDLRVFFLDKTPEAIDALRETLEASGEQEALEIWSRCKQTLRYELLMADDRTFSEEIYNKFSLEPVVAARAFLYHHHTVRDTPYSRNFVQFDGDIVTRFRDYLSILPKNLSREIVRATNKKVMYLLFAWEFDEIERYQDLEEDWEVATSWLRNGSPPDIDQNPLLFWIWENDPDLYQECLREFFNPEYVEMRELFYEVRQRTENWRAHQGQIVDPDVDDVIAWLNSDD